MVDIAYLVKGYITKSCKEKSYLYNGTSASKAFDVYNKFGEAGKAELSFFENGKLIEKIEKTKEENQIVLKWFITDDTIGNQIVVDTTLEDAKKEFKLFVDSIYESKYMDDSFSTTVRLYQVTDKSLQLIAQEFLSYDES